MDTFLVKKPKTNPPPPPHAFPAAYFIPSGFLYHFLVSVLPLEAENTKEPPGLPLCL